MPPFGSAIKKKEDKENDTPGLPRSRERVEAGSAPNLIHSTHWADSSDRMCLQC